MDWALIGVISGASVALITIVTFITQHLKPRIKAAGQFWAHLVGVEENVVTGQERIPGLFEVMRDLKAQAGRMEDRLEERLDQQDGVLAKQDDQLDKIVSDVNKAVKQVQNSHVTNLRDDIDEAIGKINSVHDKLDDHLKQCPTPAPSTTVNVEVKP